MKARTNGASTSGAGSADALVVLGIISDSPLDGAERQQLMISISVYWDREKARSSGFEGGKQVERLDRDGRDVTDLVDQGRFFTEDNGLDELRAVLAGKYGCSAQEIELEEPDEDGMASPLIDERRRRR